MLATHSTSESPEDTLKRFVEGMPSFSPATAKIIQLANTLDAPANEMVAAIRLDPMLTGKVLQLVNSAYFSLAQKVTSLNRALVYLGLNTIKNLALSTAVMQAFETKDKELANAIKPTWHHSLATAVCAKSLAKAANVPQTQIEEYFIAGLLHKLGQIILIQAFYSIAPHNGLFTLEEEKKRYGKDHAAIGAETLRRWKFSEELIGGISNYHSPLKEHPISFFIHVADAMTYRLKLNGLPDEVFASGPQINPTSWEAIRLTEAQAFGALATAAEQIEKAQVFLNISSSKEKIVEQK